MSSGTKILLAICALLIGGLMLYYSVLDDGTPNPRVVANGPVPSADPLNAPVGTREPAADRFDPKPLGRPEPEVPAADRLAFDPLESIDPLGSDGQGLLSGALARSTAPATRERTTRPRVGEPERRVPESRGLPLATAVTNLSVADDSTRPVPTDSPTVEHTVRPGETLSSIAVARLGEARRWREIARANPRVDPRRLQVGQRLVIPSVTPARSASRDPSPPPTPASAAPRAIDGETYVVQPGDTLSSIAARTLGDPNRWGEIHDANRRTIGGNENNLEVGMRLVIPKG